MRFVVVFFLLFSLKSIAQNDVSYSDTMSFVNDLKQVNTLLQSKKYTEADKKNNKLISDCIKIFGKNSKQLSQLYFFKGFINVRLKKSEEAINYLSKSVLINETLKIDKTKQHITTLFVLGELYAYTGKNKKAEITIDKAVLNINEVFNKNTNEYYSLLNRAGGFYKSLRLYEKAFPIVETVIKFVEKRYGKGIDYFVASKNLAMMYLEAGEKDKGIGVLTKIIPLAKTLEKRTSFSNQSINFYSALASLYFYSKNYLKATVIYEKLLN